MSQWSPYHLLNYPLTWFQEMEKVKNNSRNFWHHFSVVQMDRKEVIVSCVFYPPWPSATAFVRRCQQDNSLLTRVRSFSFWGKYTCRSEFQLANIICTLKSWYRWLILVPAKSVVVEKNSHVTTTRHCRWPASGPSWRTCIPRISCMYYIDI